MARAFVSMGSNIDPARNVRAALSALARHVAVTAISTVYLTPAEGQTEQPPFYNCVVEIGTERDPLDLKFQVLRPIEAALGRQRTPDKFAHRTIDLDLILYGDVVLNEEGLVLPDPEIYRRLFLAIPLAELAPELILPGSGVRVSDLAQRFGPMQPLESYTESLREMLSLLKAPLLDKHSENIG
jgi:2-amino-4-hydroxy-6-hydroxymethyldihydropteridine diphosphokinase